MKQTLAFLLVFAALTGSVAAQDHSMMDHSMPMATGSNDGRQLVNFPPHMRQRFLATMRGHLDALSGILEALAEGDHAKAGRIAAARLGLNSPAAAACKLPGHGSAKHKESGSMDMEAMMARYMPKGMREAGLKMHLSASDFAAVAARTGDGKLTYPALARVTQRCVACHGAYRVH